MARKVRQIRQKGKAISIVPVSSTAAPDLDTRIALIQALIPVALEKVRLRGLAVVEFEQAPSRARHVTGPVAIDVVLSAMSSLPRSAVSPGGRRPPRLTLGQTRYG